NAAGLDTTVFSDGVWVILANGINDIVNVNSGVYPNPFSSEIYLDFISSNKEKISISITDNLGKQIYYEDIVADKGYKLNLQKFKLSVGVYYLNLSASSKNQTIKLIKQ
ncbi:MAG: T9SS type A sorting domain-containing protein, partial [Vicingaceae bacterium]|nr:T9SS type A sorting domain-containing protein [Vicingaceae bacterium]